MTEQLRYSGPTQLRIGHEGDAGFDLPSSEEIAILPGEHTFIHTGIKIELPASTFGWVVARSSSMGSFGLMVLPGIIDHGYTGEIGVSVYNPHRMLPTTIKKGDRIAQVVLLPAVLARYELTWCDEGDMHLNPTSRGNGGFGSTGR